MRPRSALAPSPARSAKSSANSPASSRACRTPTVAGRRGAIADPRGQRGDTATYLVEAATKLGNRFRHVGSNVATADRWRRLPSSLAQSSAFLWVLVLLPNCPPTAPISGRKGWRASWGMATGLNWVGRQCLAQGWESCQGRAGARLGVLAHPASRRAMGPAGPREANELGRRWSPLARLRSWGVWYIRAPLLTSRGGPAAHQKGRPKPPQYVSEDAADGCHLPPGP